MLNIINKKLEGKTLVEINAGIGGGRLALESLGAEKVYVYEADKYAAKVYEENFGEKPENNLVVSDVPIHDILLIKLRYEDLKGLNIDVVSDPDNIICKICETIDVRKPEVIIIESVSASNIVLEFIERKSDYIVYYDMLNASDYGIPQSRKSLYCVAIWKDMLIRSFHFPAPIELRKHVEDILEPASVIPAGMYIDRADVVMNGKIEVESNRPIQIGYVGKNRQGERIYSTKGTAITLTANGGGQFSKTGGYLVDGKLRKLTPRECARVMGFPDNFKICESKNQAYKQFGNSVVVDVIQYILLSVADAIEEPNANVSKVDTAAKNKHSNVDEKSFNELVTKFIIACFKVTNCIDRLFYGFSFVLSNAFIFKQKVKGVI